jgi:hypothetical protein
MGAVTPRPGLPLWSDHTAFLRRHRVLIGALMVLGVLVGFLWTLQQSSTYSATASVSLAPVPVYVLTSPDELVPPEVSVDTDAQLLRSGPVLDAIADTLGTDRARADEHLTVTAAANTHVLHVTISADSPAQAAAGANAAVAALSDVRRETLGALSPDQLRYLRMLLGDHDIGPEDEDAGDLLVPMENEQFARIVSVRATLDELDEARAAPAEVVRPAVAPPRADYTNTEVALTSGAMLGLLAGCSVGAARDRFRTTTPLEDEDDHHVA